MNYGRQIDIWFKSIESNGWLIDIHNKKLKAPSMSLLNYFTLWTENTSPAASIAANHSSEKGTAFGGCMTNELSCLIMLFDLLLKTEQKSRYTKGINKSKGWKIRK